MPPCPSLAVSKKAASAVKKEKTAIKDKRRNNEKRKEKSRDAARSRRSRETEIFTDLANALPLSSEQVSQLDKASIMRLAISYLRVRDMINLVPELQEIRETKPIINESIFLKSVEGFLLVLSADGDFVYLSENVCEYLGITQIDLMGQNVFEYSHPCDHDEINEILSMKSQDESESFKSFFIRLKCTLTNKGRSVNLKSATYKVIHCTGHVVQRSNDINSDENDKGNLQRCLIAIGQPIPHPSNIEAPLPRQTFLTKHTLDMKFTHADDKIMLDILGYDANDLVGKSVYEYHHAMDSDSICHAFKCLFSKGQCETNRYRFLAKSGGYVWVLTQATLIYDNKIQKPQSVVCVNYVISGVECKEEIYSSSQLASVKSEILCVDDNINLPSIKEKVKQLVDEKIKSPSSISAITVNCSSPLSSPISVTSQQSISSPDSCSSSTYELTEKPCYSPLISDIFKTPLTNTSKIFAPRTEEMNKGFLTFSEDEPGLTMLKDEPDDLTHLAPVAGDVCVPLDDHPFLTDMLDDFLLRDNFTPLLTDEPTDPFISYRDSCDPSPQLLSPNLSKNSESSMTSLNSPGDSLSDEDRMSTFMTLQMDDDSINRAPYISMNMCDDLSLLMSDDLMWSSNEKPSPNDNDKTIIPNSSSSLAQLLCSTINNNNNNINNTKHSIKLNDHGGGILQSTIQQQNDKQQIIENLYNNEKNSSLNNNINNSNNKNIINNNINWNNKKNTQSNLTKLERTFTNNNKRTNTSSNYDQQQLNNKRSRNEPKEKMSSELLQQLMSNNHHRGRPKGKSNWLLDSGGQKAACISQPSDSVLMNLLGNPMLASSDQKDDSKAALRHLNMLASMKEEQENARRDAIRKNSLSLLEPEGTTLTLMDLTQQDFEVNAPVNNLLLQGNDLLTALDVNGAI